MDVVLAGMSPQIFLLACAVTLVAGFVKGAVGFAMPTIIISGLGSFLPAETALAALILPTVFTNLTQALREGLTEAWRSIRRYRLFLLTGLVFLLGSAQLVRVLPQQVLFLLIGVPIVLFAVMQLVGWRLHLPPEHRLRAEAMVGGFAGFCGGLSGVWGPPTVAFLTAIGTPKREQMRVQGVIYGLGALALLGAHVQSGVMRHETWPLSAALLVPAFLGMWAGFWAHDRMDQQRFRRATLLVLAVAGLNLIRRGLMLG